MSTTVYQARLFNPFPMSYRTDSDKMYNLESVQVMPEPNMDTCIADGEVWLEATLEAAVDNSITLLQAWSLIAHPRTRSL